MDVKRDVTQKVGLEESLDDVGKVMQRYESDIQINTSSPEKKIVTIEKKQIDEKLLEFKRQLKKEKQKPAVEPTAEPIPDPPVETPKNYPDYKELEPPTYIEKPSDSYSPNNTDAIFEALFEQEGRGKTGIGDSRQIVAGGPRQQQAAVE